MATLSNTSILGTVVDTPKIRRLRVTVRPLARVLMASPATTWLALTVITKKARIRLSTMAAAMAATAPTKAEPVIQLTVAPKKAPVSIRPSFPMFRMPARSL